MEIERLNCSVVICALARDCGESLLNNIPKIEALRNQFVESAVVVVENDSVDNTKNILNEWAHKSNDITIISNDFNTETIPAVSISNLYPGTSLHRIEKMAAYRNQYLEWIESQPRKFDIVIMIDVDVLSFSEKDVFDAIQSAPDDWGGIFSNGYTDTKVFGYSAYTMYHDMYAYLEKMPNSMPYTTYGKLFEAKKTINRKLPIQKYFKVLSAFGGLGIYKASAIFGVRYSAYANGDKYMEALCEHIMFNVEVANRGYKSYIDRDLKVYYGKSENLIVIRNLIPLWAFKALCILIRFRRLKE